MASVPSGCVPMHADRIPIAPPRTRSGAESSTSVLCIAANPDSAAPMTTSSATHARNEREPDSATRRTGATSTEAANSVRWAN